MDSPVAMIRLPSEILPLKSAGKTSTALLGLEQSLSKFFEAGLVLGEQLVQTGMAITERFAVWPATRGRRRAAVP